MRKLKLTEQEIREEIAKIEAELKKQTSVDGGKITLSFNVASETLKGEDRVMLVFTSSAYAKMCMLLMEYSSEVAWHYTVKRGPSERMFVVDDVLVYPQTVSGATVDMDQEAYASWLALLDDDTFNSLRGQAHSHVNMNVTPSGTDTKHQADVVHEMVGAGSANQFYVFQIANKRLDNYVKIFDIENNCVYENSDIDVYVIDENSKDFYCFAEDTKETMVKRSTVTAAKTTTGKTWYGGGNYGAYGGYGGKYAAEYDI